MALVTGSRLGPYEILAPLGAGGMGEVYRARDTRLDRSVAIKILPAHLSGNPEAKQRFDREARAISSLNHSNICTLHDVGHQDGIDYLVMEYLEGETLADRLIKGPLPTQQVIKYGIEICDGLERAHKSGVVHRDLKPGNIMLTKAGAKLMDFGLAKSSVAAVSASGLSDTTLATSAKPLTAAGTVVGTFQYMSPEQIEGREADSRSDIFALGAVLYEMATGKRAFAGKTAASVIAAVLERDPAPISAASPMSPPMLDRLVNTCLAKDPDERWQTAHDVKLQLKWIAEAAPLAVKSAATAPRSRAAWLTAAACALTALVLGYFYFSSAAAPRQSTRSYILPPEKTEFLFSNDRGTVALSPDGRRMVFTAHLPEQHDVLWVQPLNSHTAQPLAGSDDASFPFWSPDSRYIGFFAGGKLKKIDANGGPPQTLADAHAGRGGAWSRDGVILFTPDTLTPLRRVADTGGTAVEVTRLSTGDGENSHRWPDFLPDGKHFLYYSRSDKPENSGVFIGSLNTPERRLLFHSAWPALYIEPGYLLFPRDTTLMAQAFNPGKLALTGDVIPIAEHLTENNPSVYGVFSASRTGMLVLHAFGGANGGSQLTWADRNGKSQDVITPQSGEYLHPKLSPDGSRVAYALFESNGTSDIWVLDLARHTRSRVTFGPGYQDDPVWTSDGKFIFYSSSRGPLQGIFKMAADASGTEEGVLVRTSVQDSPLFVSQDGSYLAFQRNYGTGPHVWVLSLSGDPKSGEGKPFPAGDPASPFGEYWPGISPDGKWIAYSSSESGPYQVYIKPFPSGPGKWQVSTAGGGAAVWRADGKELFFDTANRQMMAVDVALRSGSATLGTPHLLFGGIPFISDRQGAFTVSADGKRFILNIATGNGISKPLTLITNWDAELKK